MLKIPLAAMVRRASNTRRRTITLPAINPTAAQSAELFRIYMRVVRVWHEGTRAQIVPAYSAELARIMTQDSVQDVQVVLDRIESDAVRAILEFSRAFQIWAAQVSLWHLRKFVASIKYATNVDLGSLLGTGDNAMTIEQTLARNVSLVRDVSDQVRGRISDSVFRGLQNRTPVRDVAKEIANATGLARDRARRIASDQSVKLSASLDRERQTSVGMTEFEWLHSGKIHYRPEHLARNHKIFPWDSDVGRQDPPGWAVACGCKAKGVLRLDDDD